jgi:hypothetical protein
MRRNGSLGSVSSASSITGEAASRNEIAIRAHRPFKLSRNGINHCPADPECVMSEQRFSSSRLRSSVRQRTEHTTMSIRSIRSQTSSSGILAPPWLFFPDEPPGTGSPGYRARGYIRRSVTLAVVVPGSSFWRLFPIRRACCLVGDPLRSQPAFVSSINVMSYFLSK